MKGLFAFSTSWNSESPATGEETVASIKEMGFKQIELHFSFALEKLSGIINCVKKGDIEVVSLHNFCPPPDIRGDEKPNPDSPSLADVREEERKKAVFFTKRTIDTASRVKGKVVILHSGRVEMLSRTKELIKLHNHGKKDSKIYKKIKEGLWEERRGKIKEHLDALFTSYSELLPFARERKIRLGIENRYYYREIPHVQELEEIFRLFGPEVFGYWHDIGHGYVLEHLGFFEPSYFIYNLRHNLLGVHYHDIKEFQDHLLPYQGVFDFRGFKPYFKKSRYNVIEIHPQAKKEEIIESVERLEEEFSR